MIESTTLAGIIKVLFVCIIITAAYIITTRNLISGVSAYATQSLTLVLIALLLWAIEGSPILLAIAVITFASKVLIIPYFIASI
jgi:hydrogenase-4 component E